MRETDTLDEHEGNQGLLPKVGLLAFYELESHLSEL